MKIGNYLVLVDVQNQKNMGKIEIFKGEDNLFYFRVVARNGETITIGEGYTTKENCMNGIESVKNNINSKIVDLTI